MTIQQVVAGIAVNADGKVLLVKTKHGVATPGGKIKEGETYTQALCREVLEETGLRVIRIGRFMGVDVQPLCGNYECRVFAMEVEAGTPVPGDDATAAWWGEPSEILASDIPRDYPWVLDVIYNGVGLPPVKTAYKPPTFTITGDFNPEHNADKIAKLFLEEVQNHLRKQDKLSVTLEEKNKIDYARARSKKFTPEADPKMNDTQPRWPVVVGQHWKTKDKRHNGRTVSVLSITGDHALVQGPTRKTKIKLKDLVWRYDLVVEPAKIT